MRSPNSEDGQTALGIYEPEITAVEAGRVDAVEPR
jgi:hypothetical protein